MFDQARTKVHQSAPTRTKTQDFQKWADVQIPWFAWGKGVKLGFEITEPVYTCETAATVLWLLDLDPAMPRDGAPVSSAFH